MPQLHVVERALRRALISVRGSARSTFYQESGGVAASGRCPRVLLLEIGARPTDAVQLEVSSNF
jgi:hypothetical protein